MVSWLIPANTKFYDVFAALAEPQAYWPVNAKISVGDTIYIYLAAPHKQIAFVCNVLAVSIDLASVYEQIRPFIKSSPDSKADSKTESKAFMKVKPIKPIAVEPGAALSLEYLREHGLNGMLMGARKLENNKPLFDYIRNNLGG